MAVVAAVVAAAAAAPASTRLASSPATTASTRSLIAAAAASSYWYPALEADCSSPPRQRAAMSTTATASPARRPLSISTTATSSPSPRPLHSPSRSLSSSPPQSDRSPLPSASASVSARRHHPTRRQSSIAYLPSDSPRSWALRTPPTSAHPNSARFSVGPGLGLDVSEPPELESASAKEKGRRRRSMFAGAPVAEQSSPSPDTVLTLAEKHAPLLQFIAQKEARCLELRAQLATHEQELLALKQAWERIVRRDFGRSTPGGSGGALAASPPSASASALTSTSTPGQALDGIFDAMPASLGRLLALAPPTPTAAPPPLSSVRLARHASTPSGSTSTSSTPVSSTASVRFSQSSISSVEPDELHDVDVDADTDAECDALGKPTPVDVGVGVSERMLRRRSREVSAGSTSTGKTVLAAATAATVAGSPGERAAPTLKPKDGRGRTIPSPSSKELPPPASVPGIGSLAAMGLNAQVEGWLGKRISEGSRTLSKSQKRASVILSDVSQSFLAAFSPTLSPLTPDGGRQPPSLLDADEDVSALAPSLTPALSPSLSLPLRPTPSPSLIPSPALKPSMALKPAPKLSLAPKSTTSAQDTFDDDWNW